MNLSTIAILVVYICTVLSLSIARPHMVPVKILRKYRVPSVDHWFWLESLGKTQAYLPANLTESWTQYKVIDP